MIDYYPLFTAKELYVMSCSANGKSLEWLKKPPKIRRERQQMNMHLINGMTFSEPNGFPVLQPYIGSTDFTAVPFTERKKQDGKNKALHFFLNDSRYGEQVWRNLESITYSIVNYDYYLTPDYSMWRDLPTEHFNKHNLFRTRFIGAYWQKCGFNVIPTASLGGLNSIAYCYEGLPCKSILAVSGVGNRRSAKAFDLWCYGLRCLEETRHPLKILVYGTEVEVPGLHTPLQFIPDFISTRLRKL